MERIVLVVVSNYSLEKKVIWINGALPIAASFMNKSVMLFQTQMHITFNWANSDT